MSGRRPVRGARPPRRGTVLLTGLVAVLLTGLVAGLAGCGSSGTTGLDTGPARRSTLEATPGSPSGGTPGGAAGATGSAGDAAGAGAGSAAGDAPASAATVPPPPLPRGRGSVPWATVVLGRFAGDPAGVAFARYAVARTQALSTGDARLPALLASATPQRVASDAAWLRMLRERRQTVPRTARWVVVGVERRAAKATVTACVWGPSAAFVDRSTGEFAEPVERRWYAYAMDLVRSRDAWQVSRSRDSSNPCKGVP